MVSAPAGARPAYHPRLLEAFPAKLEHCVSRDRRVLQAGEISGAQLRHLLRYDDRTSSAHGMETRVPFLDYRLVEFAYRLPWKHKIRHGWTKYVVRLYLDRHLPARVAWRKRKLGFNAPNEPWTRQLLEARGTRLAATPFRSALLRQGVSLGKLPPRQQWDAYHILHMADMMHWRSDWAEQTEPENPGG